MLKVAVDSISQQLKLSCKILFAHKVLLDSIQMLQDFLESMLVSLFELLHFLLVVLAHDRYILNLIPALEILVPSQSLNTVGIIWVVTII